MQEVFEKIKDGLTAFGKPVLCGDGYISFASLNKALEIIDRIMAKYNNGWIPVEQELPPNDGYILVSFENCSLPDIARYEEDDDGGGIFYPGDDEHSYISYDLYVNAWMPLPKPYRMKEAVDEE